MTPEEFVRAHTRLAAPPYVPEVRLRLADDAVALWERMEQEVGRTGLPVPFWACAWAGGQALARYVLDHPEVVAGRTVLDVAAGSGLVAVAAARAGAAAVTAVDVDEYAVVAVGLNAAANGVAVTARQDDVLDGDADGADVVLAGDVFYERTLARRMMEFLCRASARGARVLVGDPGRAFLPRDRFAPLATYDVPVPPDLENTTAKPSTVWCLAG